MVRRRPQTGWEQAGVSSHYSDSSGTFASLDERTIQREGGGIILHDPINNRQTRREAELHQHQVRQDIKHPYRTRPMTKTTMQEDIDKIVPMTWERLKIIIERIRAKGKAAGADERT